MRKLILFITLFITSVVTSQSYVETNGIRIEESIKVKDGKSFTKLILNGHGVRVKEWVSLYVQALYLDKKTSDPVKILDSKKSIATRLYLTSNVETRKELINSIEKAIENTYDGNFNLLKDRIHKLKTLFDSELETPGYVTFIYSAKEEKTTIYFNHQTLGVIEGLDFRKALFGIWLQENTVDKTLKRRLLGK